MEKNKISQKKTQLTSLVFYGYKPIIFIKITNKFQILHIISENSKTFIFVKYSNKLPIISFQILIISNITMFVAKFLQFSENKKTSIVD